MTDVATDNATRVAQSGSSGFVIHQFKNYATANVANITWNGQSNVACGTKTVYLQIYNRNLNQWDTLDFDDATVADTDFDLIATGVLLTNYKDANNVVACRVYQEVA